MSIDLDWPKLDAALATYLVDVLNRQLTNAERPSFIGPVEVTSLDFGSAAPDVELVDLRDIYRDFLEDEEDDQDGAPVKVTEGADEEEGFEWVSRRAVGREESLAYQHLPPHVRYGRGGPSDMYSSVPSLHTPVPLSADAVMRGLVPNFAEYRPPSQRVPLWKSTPSLGMPMYQSPTPSTPFSPGAFKQSHSGEDYSRLPPSRSDSDDSLGDPLPPITEPESAIPTPPEPPQPPPNPHPNLQLHLHINWHSNLRLTLTTSLLINYPSPMFMSLPIKLSVTGLVFTGEVAVAYEGERRRIHICVLDDMDPYGPATGGHNGLHASTSSIGASAGAPGGPAAEGVAESPSNKRDSMGSNITPPDLDSLADDSPPTAIGLGPGIGIGMMHPGRPTKPLPIGQRLLPSIFIESEIGQADKHVLKNVTRVEKFIQDVIRKTVEEELVFPNFHTLVMADPANPS